MVKGKRSWVLYGRATQAKGALKMSHTSRGFAAETCHVSVLDIRTVTASDLSFLYPNLFLQLLCTILAVMIIVAWLCKLLLL